MGSFPRERLLLLQELQILPLDFSWSVMECPNAYTWGRHCTATGHELWRFMDSALGGPVCALFNSLRKEFLDSALIPADDKTDEILCSFRSMFNQGKNDLGMQ